MRIAWDGGPFGRDTSFVPCLVRHPTPTTRRRQPPRTHNVGPVCRPPAPLALPSVSLLMALSTNPVITAVNMPLTLSVSGDRDRMRDTLWDARGAADACGVTAGA
jgi:hypothetical protein